MTKIFLIRHGEAEGNYYRRCQGQMDSPLTARGRRQLPYITKRFASVPLDAAYSSDLSRAMDTARAAVGERAIPVQPDPRLREMCFGDWENRAWGNLNWEHEELKIAFLTDPDRWIVPGAETFIQVQDRMEAALTDIARRHEGQTVVVGGHGMAIRALLARLRGVKSENISEVTLPGNTAVALLTWENGRFTVEYDNDTSHLPEPPYVPFRFAGKDAGMNRDLRYEPFDTENGKALYLRCYRDAWQIAHGSLDGFDAETCWKGALLRAADSPEALQAAYLQEEFAGILALDEPRGRSRGIGWIAFCYIVPEFRRQRCGVQLIGAAMARYRALGRKALRLTVAPSNPALGFYENTGFVRVGTEAGALGPLLVMEKKL